MCVILNPCRLAERRRSWQNRRKSGWRGLIVKEASGDKLRELEEQGLAKFKPREDSGNGSLPVLRLTKGVDDLREVIRSAKGE